MPGLARSLRLARGHGWRRSPGGLLLPYWDGPPAALDGGVVGTARKSKADGGCVGSGIVTYGDGGVVPTYVAPLLPYTNDQAVALGWPDIANAYDGDIWYCDEASGNLVGAVRGYELAPGGSPLPTQGASFGYSGELAAKKCIVQDDYPDQLKGFQYGTANAACAPRTHSICWSSLVNLGSAHSTGNIFFYSQGNDGTYVFVWVIWESIYCISKVQCDDGAGRIYSLGPIMSGGVAVDLFDGATHLMTWDWDRVNHVVHWYVDAYNAVSAPATATADIGTGSKLTFLSYPYYPWNGAAGAKGWKSAWNLIVVNAAAAGRAGHDATWAQLIARA